jgi:thioredoxin 1
MNADCARHRIRQLDARSFAKAVQHGVVLVDFDEPWCGPCRVQLNILENLATRTGSQAKFVEVDVDRAQDLAVHFHVQSLPTLLLFKDGRLRRQFFGVQRESRLKKAIQALTGE